MRTAPLGLLVVLLVASPVQAEVVSRDRALLVHAPDRVAGHTNATLNGSHARAMREAADVDDDGDVNHKEGQAFGRNFSRSLRQAQVNHTRLDGAVPTDVSIRRLGLHGLIAPTFSKEPINTTVAYVLTFPAASGGGGFALEREVRPSDAGPWRIGAPPGHRIDDVQGLNGTVLGPDDREVQGRSDGETLIRVTFVPRPDEGLPGPGTAAVAGLAVAALLLGGRRR